MSPNPSGSVARWMQGIAPTGIIALAARPPGKKVGQQARSRIAERLPGRLPFRDHLARSEGARNAPQLREGEGMVIANLDISLIPSRKRMMDSLGTARARS